MFVSILSYSCRCHILTLPIPFMISAVVLAIVSDTSAMNTAPVTPVLHPWLARHDVIGLPDTTVVHATMCLKFYGAPAVCNQRLAI